MTVMRRGRMTAKVYDLGGDGELLAHLLDVVAMHKSVRRDRMEQNLYFIGFALSDEQMSRIAGLDTGAGLFIDHEDPAAVSQMSMVPFGD